MCCAAPSFTSRLVLSAGCVQGEVQQRRRGKRCWQGVTRGGRLLLRRQERGVTQKPAMMPRRSGEATEAATAAGRLQGVPKEPHGSWVLATGTAYETGRVRGCCGMLRLCGPGEPGSTCAPHPAQPPPRCRTGSCPRRQQRLSLGSSYVTSGPRPDSQGVELIPSKSTLCVRMKHERK